MGVVAWAVGQTGCQETQCSQAGEQKQVSLEAGLCVGQGGSSANENIAGKQTCYCVFIQKLHQNTCIFSI